jgi:hypothetical protein
MASATAHTIQRRDAAVTAALVGGVLVILGYASGIGLKPQSAVSASLAVPHAPAATTAAPEGETPAPAQPVAEAPVVAAPVAGPGMVSAHVTGPAAPPTTPASAPATEPPTPPATEPAPDPAPTLSCATAPVDGLLGGLPLVSDVTSLVENLLGTPLLAVPAAPVPDAAPATCPTAARVPAAGAQ